MMKTIAGSMLVLGATVWMAASVVALTPVGTLAIQKTRGGHESAALRQMRRGVVGGRRELAGAAATSAAAPAAPFWQSVVSSTDPADLDAYLEMFPNGVFIQLADDPLAALRSAAGAAPASAGRPSIGAGGSGTLSRQAAVGEPVRRRDVFRDCPECPEMVVLASGSLAMGRYEVTVGEYRAFVSATGGTGDARWRDHGLFPQTDRHPVAFVSWNDARQYVSWLSRRTGEIYRLPTAAEWERAAAGTPAGVGCGRRDLDENTCLVGSYGANASGLSDMVGNLWEWTSDCWESNCVRRVLRGGSWLTDALYLRPGAHLGVRAASRFDNIGFRVLKVPPRAGEWRGPLATGVPPTEVAPTSDPPVNWSETENVRWKAETGVGAAPPVVWGNQAFVLTARPARDVGNIPVPDFDIWRGRPNTHPDDITSRLQFAVTALDVQDGAVVWEQVAAEGSARWSSHFRGPFTPAPAREFTGSGALVTDGEVVCILVPGLPQADGTTAYASCYDIEGHLLWGRALPLPVRSTSALHDALALHGESLAASTGAGIVVVDKRTGEVHWAHQWRTLTHQSAVLIFVEDPAGAQVVLNGPDVRGYDLKTGDIRWAIGEDSYPGAAAPVSGGGLVYIMSPGLLYALEVSLLLGVHSDANITLALFGIETCDAARHGDVPPDCRAIRWAHDGLRWAPRVGLGNNKRSAPVLDDGILYVEGASGRLSAYDAATGERLYGPVPVRATRGLLSPIVSGNRLYLTAYGSGVTTVAQVGSTYQRLGMGRLADRFFVSPAVSDGKIYLQGEQWLYSVGASGTDVRP